MSQSQILNRGQSSKTLNTGIALGYPRAYLPVAGTTTSYTRPADWLAMPSVSAGDKKIVILYAVWPEASNQTAFVVAGSAGYTVDWGDGSATQNFASGATASYNFDYTALGAGTLTSRGYRQAIVTITPQSSGTLTSFTAVTRPSTAVGTPATATTSDGMLELVVSSAALTTFRLGANGNPLTHPLIEQVRFVETGTFTSTTTMFRDCLSLKSLICDNTNIFAATTDATEMFYFCHSLPSIPSLNIGTTSGANTTSLFQGCYSLITVNDTAIRTTSARLMFGNCYALQAAPNNMTTSACTDFSFVFQNCNSLKSVPALNLSSTSLGSLDGCFQGCRSLRTAPAIAFPSATASWNGSNMFSGCSNLTQVPGYDFSRCTNAAGMFASCTKLMTIGGTINLSNATTMATMFSGCNSIQSIPNITTSASLTTTASSFLNCFNLRTAPTISNLTGVTTANQMFFGCFSMTTTPSTYTMTACTNFGSMFRDCHSLTTAPNITTSGTVTNAAAMFNSCFALETVPAYNWTIGTTADLSQFFGQCQRLTSVGTFTLPTSTGTINLNQFFNQCSSLKTIPTMNLQAVNRMDQMFLNCTSLETLPTMTTTSVSNMSSMFNGCQSLQRLPVINGAAIPSSTNMLNALASCFNLKQSFLANVKYTHSYVNCKMSNVELNAMFSNLGTTTAGNTITVTGNPGASTANTTIATNKGWGVTV